MDDLFNESDELNESQKELLEKLEEQFCDRFTERDEDFMKVINNPELIPPILAPWERSFRDRRFNRKRRRDDDFGSRDNYKKTRYDRDDDRYGRRYENDRHDDRHSRRHDDRRYDNNSENYNRNRNYR